MPERTGYPNICSSCQNQGDCTHPKDPERPRLYCEEFAPVSPPSRTVQTGDAPTAAKTDAVPQAKGLCGHCNNYADCTYPKGEAGIWHCEEYE